MQKVMNFVDKHGMMIVLVLVVLSTCTGSMSKKRYEKKVMSEFDSLKTEIKVLKQELQKEIKVEGLKVEKRMIQSTDRKILDVNRQTQIDEEINKLEKNIK
jgi:endonuclease III